MFDFLFNCAIGLATLFFVCLFLAVIQAFSGWSLL